MTEISAPERPGRTPSLLGRVFWRMGVTMLAAVAAILATLLFAFLSHMDTMRDRSLTGQVADIARHLATAANGTISLNLPPGLAAAYSSDSHGYRYTVLDTTGKLLFASPGLDRALFGAPTSKTTDVEFFQTPDPLTGDLTYVAITAIRLSGTELQIQVAQGAEHSDVLADTFFDEMLGEVVWLVLAVFAALLGVTFATLKFSLRPLEQASARASIIGPGTLDRRLPLDDIPTEIRPLVTAVNAALDRLEGGFRSQQRFTTDAAHEMRTPIALIRSHLQSLDPKIVLEVKEDLNNLERVVSQLLKLAQVDSLGIPESAVANLIEVANNVAGFLAPAAISAGKQLALSAQTKGVLVHGDADALEVALRNLVENALEHTPQGTEVEICVFTDPPSIEVLDRGPGVPEEEQSLIFERFWRKHRHKGLGAGLGLSIVSRIAAAHDARLEIRNRKEGGAAFSMIFPDPEEPAGR